MIIFHNADDIILERKNKFKTHISISTVGKTKWQMFNLVVDITLMIIIYIFSNYTIQWQWQWQIGIKSTKMKWKIYFLN